MSAFTESFAHQMRGVEHISVGRIYQCDECCCGIAEDQRNGDTILNDEGHFSWSACDGCGSTLGGNRYAAHGLIPDTRADADAGATRMLHFDVCVDCLVYIANVDEPEVWG